MAAGLLIGLSAIVVPIYAYLRVAIPTVFQTFPGDLMILAYGNMLLFPFLVGPVAPPANGGIPLKVTPLRFPATLIPSVIIVAVAAYFFLRLTRWSEPADQAGPAFCIAVWAIMVGVYASRRRRWIPRPIDA